MKKNALTPLTAIIVMLAINSHAQIKLKQNSFLLEEAYNQDIRVLQHINMLQLDPIDEIWQYTFTEEMPLSGFAHQLSLSVPILNAKPYNHMEIGLGDILLGYRYQMIDDAALAVAPRISLVLPTGDNRKGLGQNASGCKINIPVSYDINDQWAFHANLGAGYILNARNIMNQEADSLSFNYAVSTVYSLKNNLNLLLEIAGSSKQTVTGNNQTKWTDSLLASPGVAFSFDTIFDIEVVPGFAIPFDISSSSDNYSLLFYLSFQHEMF